MDKLTEKVLALDLTNLTQSELAWIHELKNKAAALTGRLQLKHAKRLDQQEAA